MSPYRQLYSCAEVQLNTLRWALHISNCRAYRWCWDLALLWSWEIWVDAERAGDEIMAETAEAVVSRIMPKLRFSTVIRVVSEAEQRVNARACRTEGEPQL